MPATPAWALQFPRGMGLEISSPRQKRPIIDYPNQHRSRGDGHHHSNRGAADEQQRARCESGVRLGEPAVMPGSVWSALGGPQWDPSAAGAVGRRSGAARCQPVHQPTAARGQDVKKEETVRKSGTTRDRPLAACAISMRSARDRHRSGCHPPAMFSVTDSGRSLESRLGKEHTSCVKRGALGVSASQ